MRKGDKAMGHVIEFDMIEAYRKKLEREEKSGVTIEKYISDVRRFFCFAGEGAQISKETVILYKKQLTEKYTAASVNSMLAALNGFLKDRNWYDCTVKALKIQREAFRSRERELTKREYYQLLEAAKKKGDMRLYYLMQTICSTGIRVSELPFITVEALQRGRAKVSSKGKSRTVILPARLCRELKRYIKTKNIRTGSIFITRNGRPLDRSNIGHAMKSLCEDADVLRWKVFPHNLRHLFACTYYRLEKDLPHLADLLGHSNVNTTRIYTLASGEEQARRIERLGLVV